MSTSKPSEKWPFCPATTEHGRMVPYEPATPEQAFCVEGGGRWLKCTQCTSSIIEPGRALQAQLDEQRSSAKQLTL
jgi:hypothetical protein